MFRPTITGSLTRWQIEVQRWNGHQIQSRASCHRNWTQQPLLTSLQRGRHCKEDPDEEKETVSEREEQQELSQIDV